MDSDAKTYVASEGGALRQGEIVAGLVQYVRDLDSEIEDQFVRRVHPLAIVVSQDCDLDWDFQQRAKGTFGSKEVPNVLLCMAQDAAIVKSMVKATEIWKRITQNKDERYQYLEAVPASMDAENLGVPALVIDFKRYFTIPTLEVYRQVERLARRRTRLEGPFLQHFASRFCVFQNRVALPREHVV